MKTTHEVLIEHVDDRYVQITWRLHGHAATVEFGVTSMAEPLVDYRELNLFGLGVAGYSPIGFRTCIGDRAPVVDGGDFFRLWRGSNAEVWRELDRRQ